MAKDVKKTEINRSYSKERKKQRKPNKIMYFLYALLIILIVVVGLTIIIKNFFFNIRTIKISGNSIYSQNEILKQSGIKAGDNMFDVDLKETKDKLLELVYIEDANVTYEMPNTICIEVHATSCEYAIEKDGSYIIVSSKGKILESSDTQPTDIPVFKGFDEKESKIGATISSDDDEQESIFYAITNSFDSTNKNISLVDMSDKYNIEITLDNRIIFQAGNWSNLEYKVKLAETAMNELDSSATGYLTMEGSNQVSYRTRAAVVKTKQDIEKSEIETESSEEDSSETDTDEDQLAQ